MRIIRSYLIIAAIAVLSFGAFITSCGKENPPSVMTIEKIVPGKIKQVETKFYILSFLENIKCPGEDEKLAYVNVKLNLNNTVKEIHIACEKLICG